MTLSDSQIEEWEKETRGIHICEIDKYVARNSLLIQEIRRLKEEVKDLHTSLNFEKSMKEKLGDALMKQRPCSETECFEGASGGGGGSGLCVHGNLIGLNKCCMERS